MRHNNSGLQLSDGEEWCSRRDDEILSWTEATEKVAQDPTLRFPHYDDLINAEEEAKKNPALRIKFNDLRSGEYWSVSSERNDPNSSFACVVTKDHRHYESHHEKKRKYWVRFIRRVVQT